LLERYASLYNGGAPPEFDAHNWRGYECASVTFAATDYRRCVGVRGFGIFTLRGVAVLGFAAGAVVVALAAIAAIVVLLRRRRPSSP
jgi:hypothetical protein